MSDPKREDESKMEAETQVPGAEAAAEDGEFDVLSELEGELDVLRAERDELKDRLLRAMAEAENARKRGERDRREAESYGGIRLARDLLPVYDNLKRALDAMSESEREAAKSVVQGIEITLRELVNAFAKHGIKPVSPEIGDPFDPQHHQAMFEAPVPSVGAGNIIQVMGEGFTIHDRLLRPAQVGVSSASAEQQAANK
ncbi:nucleotide exchange factor GrpE [Maritimibacter sp. 55A14]|uniref:nucleotide exchange factor GrpE n=1 Tax=Maritimibacter sp. 55A14 TaxID=2174844 RepID=UPI000D614137|nr:nucleotide exchange factor GrpE [Maritimibacter sp. 55A14]PWE33577.1 nucleotide exchange factor GrpE [Maritimibacter sp. 55A14]